MNNPKIPDISIRTAPNAAVARLAFGELRSPPITLLSRRFNE